MCGTVVYCLLLCSFLHLTEGEALLSMRFVSFLNSHGVGKNGYCCDGKFLFCNSACDHSFTICLDRYEGSSTDINSCSFGKFVSNEISNTNNIIFGDTIGNLANPLVWRMNSWPNQLQLKIGIVDVDFLSENDDVDFLQRSLFLQPNTIQQSVRFIMENRVQLTVEVRVYCSQHYYGGNCTTYCYPRDDSMGHYGCNELNGNKVCLTGYSGNTCETNINDCLPSLCQNNAICIDRINGFSCLCTGGYTGTNCEENMNECTEGWTGPLCNEDVNECEQIPDVCTKLDNSTGHESITNYHFACVNTKPGYLCPCAEGWTGPMCNEIVDECLQMSDICIPTQNSTQLENIANYHFTCANIQSGYICPCAENRNGTLCNEDVDECEQTTDICITIDHSTDQETIESYHFACVNSESGYLCTCSEGWTGPLCNEDVDECLQIPDVCTKLDNSAGLENTKNHHFACVNTKPGYLCPCEEGWTGEMCNEDIDECLHIPNVCTKLDNSKGLKNTTNYHFACVNRKPGYLCPCEEGWTGELCNEDVDECLQVPDVCTKLVSSTGHANITNYHFACVNTKPGYICSCAEGWTGPLCNEIVDECLQMSDICIPTQNSTQLENIANYHFTCANIQSGYLCPCAENRTGTLCNEDVDECEQTTDICITIDHSTDQETIESYHFACVNSESGYLCTCSEGWTGPLCNEDVDECLQVPDVCTKLEISAGLENTKNHHFACVNTKPGYLCPCEEGWTGEMCNEDIDECLQIPDVCTNLDNSKGLRNTTNYHFACVNTKPGYLCSCEEGWTGLLCNKDIDECLQIPDVCTKLVSSTAHANITNYHFACVNTKPGYLCPCAEGWTGPLCNEIVDECLQMSDICIPTQNSTQLENITNYHFTCANIQSGYLCPCAENRTGTLCNEDVDECEQTTDICITIDHSTDQETIESYHFACVNSESGYLCTCSEGWTGPLCNEDVDECLQVPDVCTKLEISAGLENTKNYHFACVNTKPGYLCPCEEGWTGEMCNEDIDECLHIPDVCTKLDNSKGLNNTTNYHFACVNTKPGYICSCEEGWTGILCNKDVDECLQIPDVCTKLVNSTGHESITNYHFACVNTKPGYLCPCAEGWTGPLCNETVDECLQMSDICIPTQNSTQLENITNYHFTCANIQSGYLCPCAENRNGTLCNEDVDECEQTTDICITIDHSTDQETIESYHFACVNSESGYLCTCSEGWTGPLCNEDVDECLQVPDVCTKLDISAGLEDTTIYRSACVNTKPGYLCPCKEGWTGPLCNEDVDECLQIPNVCTKLDNSTGHESIANSHFACVNTQPGYLCPCAEGWTGPLCNDECLQMSDICIPIDNSTYLEKFANYHFACANIQSGYLCPCPENQTGTLCNEDVDECEQTTDICITIDHSTDQETIESYHFACVNSESGYLCTCSEGWTGPLCNEDVDECLQVPDVCTKLDNSKGPENTTNYRSACVNTKPGYLCPCKEGWTGPMCNEDVDECLQIPNVCTKLDNSIGPENATNYRSACVNTKPGYLCSCEEGWTGELCNEDVDECLQNPDVCTKLEDSIGLENTTNYHFACVNTKPGYLCPCEEGWTGELCNEDVDECLQVPDVCTILDNSKGLENTTNYHFACVNSKPGYLCSCEEGWTGPLCNEDVDECLQIPDVCTKLDNSKGLENTTNYHFACVNTKPGYLCHCKEGWTEPLCNEDVDECLQIPDVCTKLDNSKGLENTTNYHFACVNTKPGYLCPCEEGWTGPLCNEDVDECLQIPDVCTKLDNSKGLENTTNYHFACVNTKPGYLCPCEEGWTGPLCNEDVDECLQIPDVCTKLDNSKGLGNTTNYHFACVNTKPGYLCHCKEGWTGPLCNEDVDECLQIPDVCTKLDNSKGLENTTNYHFACVNTKPGYLCPCEEGWTGPLCNEDVDECLQIPDVCTKLDNSKGLGNTTNYHFACVNTKPGYLCHCKEGWTGPLCNEDVDECLQVPDMCTKLDISTGLENTTNYHFACVNTKPGYLCPCEEGWTGPLCNEDVDECLQIPDVCTNLDNSKGLRNTTNYHFACVNTKPGYLCSCKEGWTGPLCNEDVDECLQIPDVCTKLDNSKGLENTTNYHFACVNTKPGYLCHCKEGWTGPLCNEDVDECLQIPDVCKKLDNSKDLENTTNYHFACVNTKPGYLCHCEEGWTGELCNEDVDECLQIPDVCTKLDNSKGLENTTNYHFACVNTKPGYLCSCQEGWTGSLCNEDVDECLQIPDICIPIDNSTGLENIESYHFACTNTQAGYLCTCSEGWTGHLCNEDIDECAEDVSLCVYGRNSTKNDILDIDHFTDSHSVCLNTFPGFVCICSEKWTGQNCDVNIVDNTTPVYNTESSNSQNITQSPAVSVSEKNVSVKLYLQCQIPPNTEEEINKRLKQFFKKSPFFKGKKLEVDHISEIEISTKGLYVTSIYPIVTVDDKVLSDTDVANVTNFMPEKIEDYLNCFLFKDQFTISPVVMISEIETSDWYPALITACAVLVAAVILVAVIKNRSRIKSLYLNKIQNVGGSNVYTTAEDDVADGQPSRVI